MLDETNLQNRLQIRRAFNYGGSFSPILLNRATINEQKSQKGGPRLWIGACRFLHVSLGGESYLFVYELLFWCMLTAFYPRPNSQLGCWHTHTLCVAIMDPSSLFAWGDKGGDGPLPCFTRAPKWNLSHHRVRMFIDSKPVMFSYHSGN